ncbi:CU044_5270 family protein [Actinomadura namibiensis]|nr:CU044_5270 family protein [Actinomadura namibiensis]
MRTLAGFRDGVPAMEPDAVRDARRRLHEEFRAPERRARAVWARRGAAVAGLTAALVAGVVAVPDGREDGTGRIVAPPGMPVADAEVARTAQRARTVAEATPNVVIAPKTWTYVREVVAESDGRPIGRRPRMTKAENWYTADGTRRADVGKDGRVREHRPRADVPLPDPLGPWALPKPAFLIGAPGDPAGMRDRVYAEVDRMVAMAGRGEARSVTGIDLRGRRDRVAFELIAQVLRQYHVAPRQQAALYGVLAYLEGVRVVPESVDALGRRGRAFGVVDGQGIRQEIIFDPASYRYLGGRHIFVRDQGAMRAGAVIGWNAKVDSGVVPRPGVRP